MRFFYIFCIYHFLNVSCTLLQIYFSVSQLSIYIVCIYHFLNVCAAQLQTYFSISQHSMPGMTREKTVVDVNVTEDQKQAMYDQLLQQERFKHDQITAAQARQEMMVSTRT